MLKSVDSCVFILLLLCILDITLGQTTVHSVYPREVVTGMRNAFTFYGTGLGNTHSLVTFCGNGMIACTTDTAADTSFTCTLNPNLLPIGVICDILVTTTLPNGGATITSDLKNALDVKAPVLAYISPSVFPTAKNVRIRIALDNSVDVSTLPPLTVNYRNTPTIVRLQDKSFLIVDLGGSIPHPNDFVTISFSDGSLFMRATFANEIYEINGNSPIVLAAGPSWVYTTTAKNGFTLSLFGQLLSTIRSGYAVHPSDGKKIICNSLYISNDLVTCDLKYNFLPGRVDVYLFTDVMMYNMACSYGFEVVYSPTTIDIHPTACPVGTTCSYIVPITVPKTVPFALRLPDNTFLQQSDMRVNGDSLMFRTKTFESSNPIIFNTNSDGVLSSAVAGKVGSVVKPLHFVSNKPGFVSYFPNAQLQGGNTITLTGFNFASFRPTSEGILSLRRNDDDGLGAREVKLTHIAQYDEYSDYVVITLPNSCFIASICLSGTYTLKSTISLNVNVAPLAISFRRPQSKALRISINIEWKSNSFDTVNSLFDFATAFSGALAVDFNALVGEDATYNSILKRAKMQFYILDGFNINIRAFDRVLGRYITSNERQIGQYTCISDSVVFESSLVSYCKYTGLYAEKCNSSDNPNYKNNGKSLGAAIIAVIVISALVFVCLCGYGGYRYRLFRRNHSPLISITIGGDTNTSYRQF